ncbi:hypothetical protein GJ744_009076 [Endocarpon pusillum]|uniref:Uncharacterized protein n=1 Tax=Endocarpon pusillum TaxID=364733 RepID=A0A8H7AJR4_9EURO|nr:hypothetical protein GJ744_009076 [Endocarpon pusillum]
MCLSVSQNMAGGSRRYDLDRTKLDSLQDQLRESRECQGRPEIFDQSESAIKFAADG